MGSYAVHEGLPPFSERRLSDVYPRLADDDHDFPRAADRDPV
jgi:hypothetical protein